MAHVQLVNWLCSTLGYGKAVRSALLSLAFVLMGWGVATRPTASNELICQQFIHVQHDCGLRQ